MTQEDITLSVLIGAGSFGKVYAGESAQAQALRQRAGLGRKPGGKKGSQGCVTPATAATTWPALLTGTHIVAVPCQPDKTAARV